MKLVLTEKEYNNITANGTKELISGIKNIRVKKIEKKKITQYVVDLDGEDVFVLSALVSLFATQETRDNLKALSNYNGMLTMRFPGVTNGFMTCSDKLKNRVEKRCHGAAEYSAWNPVDDDIRIPKLQSKQNAAEKNAKQADELVLPEILRDEESKRLSEFREMKFTGPISPINEDFDGDISEEFIKRMKSKINQCDECIIKPKISDNTSCREIDISKDKLMELAHTKFSLPNSNLLNADLEILDLGAPLNYNLKRKVTTVKELVNMTDEELSMMRQIGPKSVDKVKAKLAEFGLELRK